MKKINEAQISLLHSYFPDVMKSLKIHMKLIVINKKEFIMPVIALRRAKVISIKFKVFTINAFFLPPFETKTSTKCCMFKIHIKFLDKRTNINCL